MGIVALVIIGVGLLLVLAGLYVSVSDWKEERRRVAREREVDTEALGLEEGLTAVQKLADALKGEPLGFQLLILGVALITIGGILGGVAAL